MLLSKLFSSGYNACVLIAYGVRRLTNLQKEFPLNTRSKGVLTCIFQIVYRRCLFCARRCRRKDIFVLDSH